MYAKCALVEPSCEHNNAFEVTLEWCETSVKLCSSPEASLPELLCGREIQGVTYTISDEVSHSG